MENSILTYITTKGCLVSEISPSVVAIFHVMRSNMTTFHSKYDILLISVNYYSNKITDLEQTLE